MAGRYRSITRLDRETSGLTLVAKTKEMARLFCTQMERRVAEKEYLAIVWGWPAADEFTIDAPLLRQGERKPSPIYLKQMAHPDGAVAQTRFRVERRFARITTNGDHFSVVRAFPKTGRTHQIRVHLALAGHAILGDKIYGPDQDCYLEFIQTGWTPALAGQLLLPRHALHATSLALPELSLSWQSPLAADLAQWLAEPS
jgi:23S rRNA pseudouridine1911/1915/1917 synthase